MPRIHGILIALLSALPSLASAAQPHARATLLADTTAIAPSQSFRLGVLINIDPSWHIYWKNPGDSGMATKVSLQLPQEFSAGPVQFPVPLSLLLPGDILNYAYENQVMLIVPITAPATLADQQVKLTAHIKFLVCKDVCIPGSADVDLSLPVSNPSPANADLFSHWAAQLPKDQDNKNIASIVSQIDVSTGTATADIHWNIVPKDIQWLPELVDGFDFSDIKVNTTGNLSHLIMHINSPAKSPAPNAIDTLLSYSTASGHRTGLKIHLEKSTGSQLTKVQSPSPQ